MSNGKLKSSSRFFAEAWYLIMSIVSLSNRKISVSSNSSSSLPASIFEKSRMSSMIPSNAFPDVLALCAYSSCTGVSLVLSKRSVKPITPLSGVRISWLMLARNSDLVLFAFSALSFSRLSSFLFWIWIWRFTISSAKIVNSWFSLSEYWCKFLTKSKPTKPISSLLVHMGTLRTLLTFWFCRIFFASLSGNDPIS